jgi:predicted enzyme related to lactoylglutathione lyase
MLQKDGNNVAALYHMDPTQQSQGVPSSWLSYVTVEDAAEAAARARALGATVLADAFDVMDYGKMALIADPMGAVVAVWQAGNHIGAGVKDEPGALCWNELGAREPERAAEFYAALFGWTPTPLGGSDAPYTLFMNGEAQAGGMFTLTPEMAGMPPAWTPYFAVEEVDETARRTAELGGTVLHPPHDLPVGRWSLLQDPQGAMFNVLRFVPRNS